MSPTSKPDPGRNGRRDKRLFITMSCSVARGKRAAQGVTGDISLRGIFFLGTEHFGFNSFVNVTLELPGGGQLVLMGRFSGKGTSTIKLEGMIGKEKKEFTYDVTFPVLGKVEVNGPEAAPLYSYLRSEAPGDFGPQYGGFYDAISKIRPGADGTDEVKWNFTKFLIGRDGTVIKRYEPPVAPADIKADLENYL